MLKKGIQTLLNKTFLIKTSLIVSTLFLLLLISLIIFLVFFSNYLKQPIINELEKFTELDVSLDKVYFEFNKKDLMLNISNVKFSTIDSKKQLVAVGNIKANVNFIDLITRKRDIENIYIKNVKLNFSKNIENTWEVILNKLNLANNPIAIIPNIDIKIDDIYLIFDKTYHIKSSSLIINNNTANIKLNDQFLGFQKIFSQPIPNFNLGAKFDFNDMNIIKINDIYIKNNDVNLTANLTYNLKGNIIYLTGLAHNIKSQNLKNYVPDKVINQTAANWLKNAFIAGDIEQVIFLLSGNLTELPFINTNKNNFNFDILIRNNELNFHNKWPNIKNLNGTISIKNEKLVVNANGDIDKIGFKDAQVVIPNIMTKKPVVEINARTLIDSKKVLQFLKNDALYEDIGSNIEDLNISGIGDIAVKLFIPTSRHDNKESIIDIAGKFRSNKLSIKDTGINVDNLNATVKYYQGKLTATGEGYFREMPHNFDLSFSEKESLNINLNSKLLKANIYLQGNDLWSADFFSKFANGNLIFSKDAKKNPWKLDIEYLDLKNLFTTKKQNINLFLNDLPNFFDINIKELKFYNDFSTIKDFKSKVSYDNKKEHIKANGEFSFNKINSNFDLDFKDKNNFKTVINSKQFSSEITSMDDNLLNVIFSNNIVDGSLILPYNYINNTAKIKLKKLNLSKLVENKNDSDIKLSPKDLYNFDLVIDNVLLNGKELGSVFAKFNKQDEYLKITKGTIKDKDFNIDFVGKWSDSEFEIDFGLYSDELAGILKKFDIKVSADKGKTKIKGILSCPCKPWQVKLKDINGNLNFDIKEGSFTDEGNPFAKLLSLLNIRSLKDYIKFDLDDIFAKGFQYDKISAKINLSRALAIMKSFKLESKSSDITIGGYSDLANKSFNYDAVVRPKTSSALPVTSFLLGGGLAGLGIWTIDEFLLGGKIMKKTVDRIIDFEYKITGPWDNPVIE